MPDGILLNNSVSSARLRSILADKARGYTLPDEPELTAAALHINFIASAFSEGRLRLQAVARVNDAFRAIETLRSFHLERLERARAEDVCLFERELKLSAEFEAYASSLNDHPLELSMDAPGAALMPLFDDDGNKVHRWRQFAPILANIVRRLLLPLNRGKLGRSQDGPLA